MLSDKTILLVDMMCHAVALDLFSLFSNPKMRGPKFNWETIGGHVVNMCETQCGLNLGLPKTQKEEALKYARMRGEQIWTRAIEQAGHKE